MRESPKPADLRASLAIGVVKMHEAGIGQIHRLIGMFPHQPHYFANVFGQPERADDQLAPDRRAARRR
jgi:hypothetical protein